jgi:hypothetical protein
MWYPLITVKRIARHAEGVFGAMLHLDVPFAVTLERSDGPDNAPVIPAGVYQCVKTTYYKGGYPTFEIVGVDGHARLLFHKANKESDLRGCVGIGESFAKLDGRLAIAQSGAGFAEFMERVGDLPGFQVRFEDCAS